MRGSNVHRAAAAALSCSLVGLVGGCSGHEGGADRWVPDAPAPSVLGDGARLDQINDPARPRPSLTAKLDVTGVVVTARDDFDETGDGKSVGNLYVQDAVAAPLPYGGIEVYGPGFSPPDLKIAAGDVVDVRGALYEEFAGPASFPFPSGETLPELASGTVGLRFEWRAPVARSAGFDAAGVARPILVDLASYATGRRWLGMLVKLEDVTVASTTASSGRFSATLSGSSVTVTNSLAPIDTFGAAGAPIAGGTHFASVTGVVMYFAGFSVAPRGASDLVP